jgi:hypothetical protein
MDPDSDANANPAIFLIDLQDANKKLIKKVFCILLFEVKKKSQNSRNQGFSYYFCLMIEGSGVGSGSEYIPLTNRIRIRIPNNVKKGRFFTLNISMNSKQQREEVTYCSFPFILVGR